MDLNIFENDPIALDQINFDLWLTEDGEWVEIGELSDQQVEDAIYTLKRKLRLLPEHVNEDIWEEYLYLFQKEAYERKSGNVK